jgi:hypothetical protein
MHSYITLYTWLLTHDYIPMTVWNLTIGARCDRSDLNRQNLTVTLIHSVPHSSYTVTVSHSIHVIPSTNPVYTNFMNLGYGNPLVKISAIFRSDCTYINVTRSSATFWLNQWYLILMCLVVLWNTRLLANSIADLLSIKHWIGPSSSFRR